MSGVILRILLLIVELWCVFIADMMLLVHHGFIALSPLLIMIITRALATGYATQSFGDDSIIVMEHGHH